jgi:hypothetical protein
MENGTFIATALTTGQRNLITFGVVTDWLHDLNYGTFFINVKKKGRPFGLPRKLMKNTKPSKVIPTPFRPQSQPW